MGVVAKQSVRNLGVLFIGVFLGALNIIILYPSIISDEEFGLTRIILSIAMIASNFSMVGTSYILIRYMPSFSKTLEDKKKLLWLVIKIVFFGLTIIYLILFFFQQNILDNFSENSALLVQEYYLIFFLVFFISINDFLSSYSRSIFKSIFQNFVKEILIRLIQTILLVCVFFNWIGFNDLLYGLVGAYAIASFALLFYLLKIKEIDFRRLSTTKIKNRKAIVTYGATNFLSSIATNLTTRIDALMIASMIGCVLCSENAGLEAIAIYSWALYLSVMTEMPGRALTSIAAPAISKAWENNDLKTIDSLYKKSSIIQLTVGLLIFAGIWLNWDLLILINDEYQEAKYVLLFLSIGKLIIGGIGLNGVIVSTSKYYYFTFIVMSLLIVLTYFTNLYFIPIYGIVGASIATTISLAIFSVISYFFVLIKFKIQPFNHKTILVLGIAGFSYFLADLINLFDTLLFNLFFKSVLLVVVYISLVYFLNISTDINQWINKIKKKAFSK